MTQKRTHKRYPDPFKEEAVAMDRQEQIRLIEQNEQQLLQGRRRSALASIRL